MGKLLPRALAAALLLAASALALLLRQYARTADAC